MWKKTVLLREVSWERARGQPRWQVEGSFQEKAESMREIVCRGEIL
jgi:hypothetical protein